MKLSEFLELKGYRFLTTTEAKYFSIPDSRFESEGYLEMFSDNELDDGVCYRLLHDYKKQYHDLCAINRRLIDRIDRILMHIESKKDTLIDKVQSPKHQFSLNRKSRSERKKENKRKISKPPTSKVDNPKFLDSFEWKKTRMEALKRSDGRCDCCGRSKKDGIVLNVDHINPRKTHPELALTVSNLQVLCGDCNHGKGNWDNTNWRDRDKLYLPTSSSAPAKGARIIIRKRSASINS